MQKKQENNSAHHQFQDLKTSLMDFLDQYQRRRANKTFTWGVNEDRVKAASFIQALTENITANQSELGDLSTDYAGPKHKRAREKLCFNALKGALLLESMKIQNSYSASFFSFSSPQNATLYVLIQEKLNIENLETIQQESASWLQALQTYLNLILSNRKWDGDPRYAETILESIAASQAAQQSTTPLQAVA